jgi:hypothetical protein
LHKGEMVRDVTTTTATLQELEQFFQEQL